MTGVSFFIRDINCNKLSRITNKKTGEFKMTYVACTRLNIGKKMLKIPNQSGCRLEIMSLMTRLYVQQTYFERVGSQLQHLVFVKHECIDQVPK